MSTERIAAIDREVARRSGRRERNGEVRFTCPEPDRHQNGDANPSARWNAAKQVWRCDVCEEGGGWIDLERRLGLAPESAPSSPPPSRPRLRTPQPTTRPRRRIVQTYTYIDAAGAPVSQTVRFEPKHFSQRRPRQPNEDVTALRAHNITIDAEWVWSLQRSVPAADACSVCGAAHRLEPIPLVAYRLPEVLAATPTTPIYIVEGEKDADALAALGCVATTNSGGAGKWRHEYTEALSDRLVVILPDNDTSGRAHAEGVARSLAGIAASVRIVTLPGVPEKGDVSDWTAAGGTRAQLEALVADAEPLPASDSVPVPNSEGWQETNCEPEDPRWLPVLIDALPDADGQAPWVLNGYLAKGAITLLIGLWKAGKTTLLVQLLHAIATGDATFAGRPLCGARVLVISEEPAMLWRQRGERFKLSGVSIVCRPFICRPDQRTWERFLAYVATFVRTHGIDLVVFDTLASLWPVKDENDASQVTAALMPVRSLGDAAVLLVHHPRKGDAAEGQAARGSGALPGFVEIIVELRRFDPQRRDDTRRVLTSYSRFDDTPAELVLEYDPEGGYRAVGTKHDATRTERLAVVQAIVGRKFLTVEEIRCRWPEDGLPKPGERTLHRDLEDAFAQKSVGRIGAGKKGDPHRYGTHRDEDPGVLVGNSIPASSIAYRQETNPLADAPEMDGLDV